MTVCHPPCFGDRRRDHGLLRITEAWRMAHGHLHLGDLGLRRRAANGSAMAKKRGIKRDARKHITRRRGDAEDKMMELDDITGAIIDAAIKIHRDLGPGLLESVYEVILAKALEKRGLRVQRQVPFRFHYDGVVFEEGFRIDLLVEERVIVELKSIEALVPVHGKIVLTYLRLMNLQVGLLINFGEEVLKDGIHRIVNKLP